MRRPPRRIQALASGNVVVTGAVDDIRPYLGKAAVCVVPLRSGSGTRIKIFEAMAMGKAVISTTMGAEGLPVRHGENIVLADDPADFARQVVQLLREPQRRAQLGRAARRLVEGPCAIVYTGPLTANVSLYVAPDVAVVAGTTIRVCTE